MVELEQHIDFLGPHVVKVDYCKTKIMALSKEHANMLVLICKLEFGTVWKLDISVS